MNDDSINWRQIAGDLRTALESRNRDVTVLRNELAGLRASCVKENDDICQILGKALGCPWFKDDQKNFPGATEASGVCVGDEVAASLAMGAATEIRQLRAEREWRPVADAPMNEYVLTLPVNPIHGIHTRKQAKGLLHWWLPGSMGGVECKGWLPLPPSPKEPPR